LNLRAFRQDVEAYFGSSWPPSQRLKALGLLFLHRWNVYSPATLKPAVQLTIPYQQQLLKLPMRMDTDDFFAFQEIFVYHYYDHPLGDPATILDLGANCGYATLVLAARYPAARIACVEPHPANLAALRSNLQLNGVAATIIAGAATREEGPTTLFLKRSLSHTLMPGGSANPDNAITVRGFSISTLLNQLGWDHIDVLKIDIEGYERILFADRPAWLGQVNRIIGEFHRDYGIEAVRADLLPFGFSVSALPHPQMFLAVRSEPERSRRGVGPY
jgi:FkbM family methyltransferase